MEGLIRSYSSIQLGAGLHKRRVWGGLRVEEMGDLRHHLVYHTCPLDHMLLVRPLGY
jgi:hypothetical protein